MNWAYDLLIYAGVSAEAASWAVAACFVVITYFILSAIVRIFK